MPRFALSKPKFTVVKRHAGPIGVILAGVVIAFLALVCLVLVTALVVTRSAAPHIVGKPQDAPQAKVAIVLGALVYQDGTPSSMVADRLDTAIQLYKLGKVQKLLISGDHGTTAYDEVNAMLKYCVDRGIPDEDVFTDHAGFDTYDTMYRARDVFKVTDCLIVTQGFHVPRAVYTARHLGLDATGVVADIQTYQGEWKSSMREWAARVKAIWQLGVTHPKPKFLGPAIPIDGDGRATRG
jgi:SanA protein